MCEAPNCGVGLFSTIEFEELLFAGDLLPAAQNEIVSPQIKISLDCPLHLREHAGPNTS